MSRSYTELLEEKKEKFISFRTKQELSVAEFHEKVSGLDPAILNAINWPGGCFPDKLTLRDLIPELYEDKPNVEIYRKQLAEANKIFDQLREIADRYNEEAVACLSEFQAISSTQA